MNEGLTASDVLALTRNNNEEGMWNNPFIYLVWLAVLGNGGLFGNRGVGDAAVQGAITRSDLFEGFNNQGCKWSASWYHQWSLRWLLCYQQWLKGWFLWHSSRYQRWFLWYPGSLGRKSFCRTELLLRN